MAKHLNSAIRFNLKEKPLHVLLDSGNDKKIINKDGLHMVSKLK